MYYQFFTEEIEVRKKNQVTSPNSKERQDLHPDLADPKHYTFESLLGITLGGVWAWNQDLSCARQMLNPCTISPVPNQPVCQPLH